jgi:hypothetical protein
MLGIKPWTIKPTVAVKDCHLVSKEINEKQGIIPT